MLDKKDEHHSETVEIVTSLARNRYRQFTTNILLIEAHALILSNIGSSQATQFLRDMDGSNTVVVRVRALDEERAKLILYRYTDKDFSFADAISFAVMERLGLSWAFTFDHHFSQYGLHIVSTNSPSWGP